MNVAASGCVGAPTAPAQERGPPSISAFASSRPQLIDALVRTLGRMPDAPSSNLLTQYVLENPWPLGLTLLIIAAIVMFLGLREGLTQRTRVAFFVGVVGAAIIAAGMLTTTAGEHSLRVTRALVDAVVSKDMVGGIALFSEEATMNVGSPFNPGRDLTFIEQQFSALASRYTIESNTITTLRGVTISGDEAEARLACLTTIEGSPYSHASQWIVRVRRSGDGAWRIEKITCVSINGNTPPLERMW